MDEFVIGFINDSDIYQELTFRGVTESVAKAMAEGLLAAQFNQVTLTAKEMVGREVNILPGAEE